MEINKNNIEKKLRDAFEPTYLNVEDCSSGCGLKFDTIIVSQKFEGKQLLARQRLVNDLLKDEMTKIHAFTQKTYTPDEWEKKQEKAATNPDCPIKSTSACTGNCGNCPK
ncbi:unnamed protein product [Adineta ricciae]|uniref:BolA-like protein n=1 Tax=Adineta ricciae TaxID=249248 RepID=A0A813RRN1_ADIRI|nr:unnamed protein product [Adineta ricciae]CAF1234723.1 unnamed protein product [Adineta ricciae]